MHLTQKQEAVDEVFKPDKNGISKSVSRDILVNHPVLKFGNNGNGRQGIFFKDPRYKWVKEGKHKVISLKLNGFTDNPNLSTSRPIRDDIILALKNKLCVSCGNPNVVCDHKNDCYNEPLVYDVKLQTVDDFQPLCNQCNLMKRSHHSKECKANKILSAKRFVPRYSMYNFVFPWELEHFDVSDETCKVGAFWHDPIEFEFKIDAYKTSTLLIVKAIKKYWTSKNTHSLTHDIENIKIR